MAKLLVSFIGRVEAFVGDSAMVTLLNQVNGSRLEADCSVQLLKDHGIGEHDEFLCEVVEAAPSGAQVNLRRLEPKPITPERMAEIRKEIGDFNL